MNSRQMFRQRFGVLLALLGGVAIPGCSLFSEQTSLAVGSYALFKFGSGALPTKIFELPTQDGQPSGCWYTLTEGTLQLSSGADHRFEYTLVYRDSCDGRVLWTTNESGEFVQDGSTLTFTVTGVDSTVSFRGTVSGETVSVERGVGYSYSFRKKS